MNFSTHLSQDADNSAYLLQDEKECMKKAVRDFRTANDYFKKVEHLMGKYMSKLHELKLLQMLG